MRLHGGDKESKSKSINKGELRDGFHGSNTTARKLKPRIEEAMAAIFETTSQTKTSSESVSPDKIHGLKAEFCEASPQNRDNR